VSDRTYYRIIAAVQRVVAAAKELVAAEAALRDRPARRSRVPESDDNWQRKHPEVA
jgi:hypothetical protein